MFCDPLLVGDLLQGFRTFAVRFMIQMSRVSISTTTVTHVFETVFDWIIFRCIFLTNVVQTIDI